MNIIINIMFVQTYIRRLDAAAMALVHACMRGMRSRELQFLHAPGPDYIAILVQWEHLNNVMSHHLLFQAVENNDKDSAQQWLWWLGQNPEKVGMLNDKDVSGNTAAHLAAKLNRDEILKMMFSSKLGTVQSCPQAPQSFSMHASVEKDRGTWERGWILSVYYVIVTMQTIALSGLFELYARGKIKQFVSRDTTLPVRGIWQFYPRAMYHDHSVVEGRQWFSQYYTAGCSFDL